MSPNASSPRLRDEIERPDSDLMPELPDPGADMPAPEDTEAAARPKPPLRKAETKAKPAAREIPAFEEAEAAELDFGADIERELVAPKVKKPSTLGTLFLLILTAIVGLAIGFILVMQL